MKRLILMVAMLVPMLLAAQKSPVDKLFDKYANQDGFTTVNISGKLLGMAGKMDKSNPDTNDMLNKLSGIRILSVDDEALNSKLDFYKELETDGFFRNNTYEVLMEVTEKNEVVRFYGRTSGEGKYEELLLVVGGKSNALISIRGIIDPDNIGKIMDGLDVDVNVSKKH